MNLFHTQVFVDHDCSALSLEMIRLFKVSSSRCEQPVENFEVFFLGFGKGSVMFDLVD